MPSYARKHQLTKSLIYHIYNRSNGKVQIFKEDKDYKYLIDTFIRYKNRFCAKIFNWVIMPNHYHFILEIEDPEKISKKMAGIAMRYTRYYHKKYGTAGYLWQGRFKMQPIEKESYLIACGRYIDRNPVRSGIVREAGEYIYSSARYYIEGVCDGLTERHEIYNSLGNDDNERGEVYKEFLKDFNSEEEILFKEKSSPVGSKIFRSKLVKIKGRYFPRRCGRSRERIVL